MLDVGVHDAEATVFIKACLVQGAGYPQRIVAKANLTALLLVALSKLNANTAASIANLANEAAILETDEARMTIELKAIKEYADKAWAAITAATTTNCKGKLTIRGKVDIRVISASDVFVPVEPVKTEAA